MGEEIRVDRGKEYGNVRTSCRREVKVQGREGKNGKTKETGLPRKESVVYRSRESPVFGLTMEEFTR